MKQFFTLIITIMMITCSPPILAGPHDTKVLLLLKEDVQKWINDPLVISSVKQQNNENISLSQDDVVKLDKVWRAEKKSNDRPLINKILSNKLSQYLKSIKDRSDGLYAEIFIMDNKGLNVGQSDITSDYWQGDEAKWQKTYLVGPKAILIDNIEYDGSAERFQIQISIPVVDKASNTNIGAATIGVSMRKLVLRKIK